MMMNEKCFFLHYMELPPSENMSLRQHVRIIKSLKCHLCKNVMTMTTRYNVLRDTYSEEKVLLSPLNKTHTKNFFQRLSFSLISHYCQEKDFIEVYCVCVCLCVFGVFEKN